MRLLLGDEEKGPGRQRRPDNEARLDKGFRQPLAVGTAGTQGKPSKQQQGQEEKKGQQKMRQ